MSRFPQSLGGNTRVYRFKLFYSSISNCVHIYRIHYRWIKNVVIWWCFSWQISTCRLNMGLIFILPKITWSLVRFLNSWLNLIHIIRLIGIVILVNNHRFLKHFTHWATILSNYISIWRIRIILRNLNCKILSLIVRTSLSNILKLFRIIIYHI
jgi:hypothetical protein